MTYRGTVRNGVVVLDEPQLPEGTLVDVTPVAEGAESLGDLPAFGMWSDRSEFTDAGRASLDLRAQVERREDASDHRR